MIAYDEGGVVVRLGDCRDVLATLPDASIDAVVTDPPYELGFMGKSWDRTGVAFDPATWAECLRVLKPGGHIVAFGGSRTFHRIAVAIEDGGFEIRDTLSWLYGSGFPKSLDVSKAIDKAAGAERPVIAPVAIPARNRNGTNALGGSWQDNPMVTGPATKHATRWQGWGTALKPGWEPIILARKPLIGTVAANVTEHGTGALNIDGCRIETDDALGRNNHVGPYSSGRTWNTSKTPGVDGTNSGLSGRWPANVVLDEAAAELLDQQNGASASRIGKPRGSTKPGDGWGMTATGAEYDDFGGASRFFKVVEDDEKARNDADFMVQCDCYCETPEGERWARPDQSQSIQVASDTPLPRATTVSMFGTESRDEPSWPTSLNGSGTTDPCQTECKSTTSTSTSRTITSTTSSLSTPSPTSACTPDANSEKGSGGSRARSAANSSPLTQSTGTSVERAGHSTDDVGHATSERSLPISNGGETPRFLYTAKASRRERNAGLPEGSSCSHPTVKPLALMRWLVRLVTPPGGVILDPFGGSGTTAVAAYQEGFRAVLIEREPEYVEIEIGRIRHAQKHGRQARLELEVAS